MLNYTLFSFIWIAFWPKSLGALPPKPPMGKLAVLPHNP